MNTYEYIVTLWRHEDLGSFYNDMETNGCSCQEVPVRAVQCCKRRDISRNTHYMLTEEEAEALRSSEKVRAVEKVDDLPKIKLDATQTSNFNRGLDTDANHINQFHNTDKNWGLYRHFVDTSPANWGNESGNANAFPRTNQTISWELEGEHVDIVISDELADPDHPEFAVNADGTGGTRVQSIDWTDYGSSIVDHWKSALFDSRASHGSLCASSAAGNTHGLARKSNIYCINVTDKPKFGKFFGTRSGSVLTVTSVVPGSEPIQVGQFLDSSLDSDVHDYIKIGSFGTGTGGVGTYNLATDISSIPVPTTNQPITCEYFTCEYFLGSSFLFDHVRAWHKTKPVNTVTNRRNPTILNASWGAPTYEAYSSLTSVQYRGTTYTSSDTTWTPLNLWAQFGIVPSPFYQLGETDATATYFTYPSTTNTSMTSDWEDAIADGIIIVSSAGNSRNKMDLPTGNDYNNTINNVSQYKYMSGGFKNTTDAIIVGALSNEIESGSEYKSNFSNTGPRVDIFAPGSAIIGADSGDPGHGKIVSWSRTNNVVTFVIEGPYSTLDFFDYCDSFAVPNTDVRLKIQMDTTTSLNGFHNFTGLYDPNPSTEDPSGFTIDSIGPDVASTTESGTFYACLENTTDALFGWDHLCDTRDDNKYLYQANGTSFSGPMIAGLVACWTGYFGRLDRQEFNALMSEYGAKNKMISGATDDYDDEQALLGSANIISRYADFRATSGFTYPQNTHKARSTATVKGETSYVAFPRQRVLRYGA